MIGVAKRVSRSRRNDPGIVMLSTSSRLRHSLSILYILSLSLKRDSHPSLLSALCVSFFFSCVYLPLKVAGGCTACISLNDSVIFLSHLSSHARRTCSRLSETSRIKKKTHFTLFVANAPVRRIALSRDNLVFPTNHIIFAYHSPSSISFPRNMHEQSLREHLQRPALDVRPHEGIPRECLRLNRLT